jgi:acyl-CoA oxidase
MLTSKVSFRVEDMQRLYYDMQGLSSLSLEEIRRIQKEGDHLYANVDTYYYKERLEQIEDYYERLSKYQKLMMEKGMAQNPEDIKHKILHLHKFNLDYGSLFLHYHAFLPAVELLASDEQAKKWLPLIRDLKITGAYAQTELGHGSDVQNLQTTASYD